MVDPNKWAVAIEDDFVTLAPEGEFLDVYRDRWDAYPPTYHTTSGRGYYDPDRISVIDTPGGLRVMQSRLVPGDENDNGKPSGTAAQPKINGSGANGTLGEKGEMRLRVAKTARGWHAANLGWPLDDDDWPEYGEADVFETDLRHTAMASAFLHVEHGGSDGEGQVSFSSNVAITKWLRVGWERIPGVYFKWFVNGKLIKKVTGDDLQPPYGIPSHEFRWVLQLEDDGNGPTSEALVWYDWFTLWVPPAVWFSPMSPSAPLIGDRS